MVPSLLRPSTFSFRAHANECSLHSVAADSLALAGIPAAPSVASRSRRILRAHQRVCPCRACRSPRLPLAAPSARRAFRCPSLPRAAPDDRAARTCSATRNMQHSTACLVQHSTACLVQHSTPCLVQHSTPCLVQHSTPCLVWPPRVALRLQRV